MQTTEASYMDSSTKDCLVRVMLGPCMTGQAHLLSMIDNVLEFWMNILARCLPQDNGHLGTIAMRVDDNKYIGSIHFDQLAVLKSIGKIKPNLTSWPESFLPLLFKRLGASLYGWAIVDDV